MPSFSCETFVSRVLKSLFHRNRLRRRTKTLPALSPEQLEIRLNLSTVSVVSGELRVDGTNDENNTMTVDYAADVYTITDTNPLTASTAGLTQVNANTVTVPGTMVSTRVRVYMRGGTNIATINDNGGSGWGNEGLFVRNDSTVNETAIIGTGGVTVQAGAGLGTVSLQTDIVELNGTVSTSDNNPITIGVNTADTVDVTANSTLNAGSGQVTVNGAISSTNDSDLTVVGINTFFDANAIGFGALDVTANLMRFDAAVSGTDVTLTSTFQTTVSGTLTADSATLNGPDLNLASAVVEDLVIQAGNLSVSGTIAPATAAGSSVTLQSRVAGNDITVFNVAAAATDPDSLNLDTTDLGLFAGFEQLVIGGQQLGTQTGKITLVNDHQSSTKLVLPTDTTLMAGQIDMNEGVDPNGNDVEFRTTTMNANNRRAFGGLGNVTFQALPTAEGGDGTIAVTGKAQAFGTNVPTLSIVADSSATITAQVGNFSSITIDTPAASFNTGNSAMTSRGDIRFNDGVASGALSVAGGLFADGDIFVNGSYVLLSDNLLFARNGGNIEITGSVAGSGNALQARGVKGNPAGTVTLGGGVSDAAGLSVLHTVDVNLGGTVDVNVAGGDVQVRNSGNLSIGGDILSADKIDLVFGTADLNGGDRVINSVNDSRVQLVGDLSGTETLTVDILTGTYARVGSDGGVTINAV